MKNLITPEISVIVPTYGRPDRLAECIKALSNSRGILFEAIIVDDGSPQPIHQIVDQFKGRINISCYRQENQGPAAARNVGARLARAPALAFTDDDCRPHSNWLLQISQGLRKGGPHALVGGATYNLLTENIFSEASQDLVSFLYDWAQKDLRGFDFFASNNLGCNKEDFLAIGGFDQTFPLAAAEDRDLGLRWKEQGWPLFFDPLAQVGHSHNLSSAKFWTQQANYGRGSFHLRKRMKLRKSEPVRFEGLNFYLDLCTYPFSKRRPHLLKRSFLLTLSQVATVAGFFMEAIGQ